MKALTIILLGFLFTHGKSFDAQLKSYLKDKLSSYEKYEYQILRQPQDNHLEIDTDKNFRLSGEYAYVPVVTFDARNKASHSIVTLRVKLYKNVLVADQRIDRDETLSASMFSEKLMNVAKLEGNLVEANALKDSRSKIIIAERSILMENMIEPIPVINSGDKVTIHTGDKSVAVSIEGIARQDGNVDQVISVQCQSKIFKAKVIDKHNLSLVE